MTAEAPTIKGHLPMLLLAVLQRGAQNATAIREALVQASAGRFAGSDQNVYPALHRLEHLGLVASSWSVHNGRHVRTYLLTPEGREQLIVYRRAWEGFVEAISALLEPPGG